jgi:uridine phosphorylase
MQPHIKCQEGDIAKIVLIPGDPARVKKIVTYWDEAKEVANNREFLTYTGKYKGIPISATSTGIGGPSAAIAVEELANIGAKAFIRIGTCGAFKKEINPGDLIIPFAAIRAEGTTKEYVPAEFPAVADPNIFRTLEETAKEKSFVYFTGINRTHDAFYEHLDNMLRWGDIYKDKRMSKWNTPLVSSEMECSTVFLVAMLRGLKCGTILSVNTTEPLDEIAENPDLIYELIESPNAADGIDKAIQVALDTAVKISPSIE